ncbi:hypothetical protein AB0M28_21005 [Streptomyces sp. NPDC051940]|uniref:hypothetical protein n=1 Tax=Streptomyces sp. NPDC051940 TaxID=3155675 RepID=UPI00343143F2
MPRRVSLPGADELFRTTGGMALQSSTPGGGASASRPSANGEGPEGSTATASAAGSSEDDEKESSGAAAGGSDEPEHSGRRSEAPVAAPPQQRVQSPGDPARAKAPRAGAPGTGSGSAPAAAAAAGQRRRGRPAARRPSGRERHDEKITVYVSAEELMDLEQARLVLRGEHGLAVDRGRIVREAVAVVLADLESRGEASILVRRLRGR